jgi:glycosyltransferase involved in cell wall biosynthesis
MRILHVIPYFSPRRGGDVNVCHMLSKHLAKMGHEVTIITTDLELDEGFVNSVRDEGIEVVIFHNVVNASLFLVSPSMKAWVIKNIRNYDIVHMHSFRSYQNIIVSKYCKRYGIPYVLQAHGSVLPSLGKESLKRIFDMVWGHKYLESASRVIAVADMESMQYRYMGASESKIELIPNGIELAKFINLPQRGEFRKRYLPGGDKRIVLYLGRLHEIKGIGLLVDAYAKIVKSVQDSALVIIGPDFGLLPALKEQIAGLGIKNDVLILGPLYGEDKLKAFVDADVYVLPSSYEIFSIAVLEACACNTPVVVTDRCGIAKAIDDTVGIVVGYDERALASAIIDILSSRKLHDRYADNCKDMVSRYDWESIVRKLEQVYCELTGENRSRVKMPAIPLPVH